VPLQADLSTTTNQMFEVTLLLLLPYLLLYKQNALHVIDPPVIVSVKLIAIEVQSWRESQIILQSPIIRR